MTAPASQAQAGAWRRGTRHRRLTPLLTVALIALTACGGISDTSRAPSVATVRTPAAATPRPCPVPDDGAQGTLAAARRRGYLVVGIAGEAPYGYLDTHGRPTGQGPELALEVLCRLGIPTIRAEVVDFGALIPALDAGRYDIIAAGMFINSERARRVRFSDPYFCESTAFAVAAGNPLELSDFRSLVAADASLGVLRGAVEDASAQQAGVPPHRVTRFETTADLFDALQAADIDAAALTEATIHHHTSKTERIEAAPGFVPQVNDQPQLGCGAFAFRRGDYSLYEHFNTALAAMKNDGDVTPIVTPHGFSEATVERAWHLRPEHVLNGIHDAGSL